MKRTIIIKFIKIMMAICIVLLRKEVYAQSFYDISTIQKIEIEFEQNNWDYLLDTAKAGSESYIMAKSVTINDEVYDSVGVKYKGNSTYQANQKKNPFHIELDTYKNQDYQGYKDIKLSNVYNDPSYLREVLSYDILRKYMYAPLSNFANVYVNDELLGLYVSSESIGKTYVNTYFNSKDKPFFKCNPIDGALPGNSSSSLPNLVYLGSDSSQYTSAYEMKSDYGWKELIDLCYTLEYEISQIESILDVDRALWMLAFDNITVNLDSYIGGFAQNYYLYKDNSGRFSCILWDFNESFGVFDQTGTINLQNTSSKSRMTHLLHSGDAKWPLVQKLLAVPRYKKMYLAHMYTILTENFSDNSYFTRGEYIQQIINNSVQADPNKFYTYSQYQMNLNSDISSGPGPGGKTIPGIKELMNARSTYLSALADFTNARPTISNVMPSETAPELNSEIYITADIIDVNSDAVLLGYRYEQDDMFIKIPMYDDGLHGDGKANDNTYGAALDIENTSVQYYIYAENDNTGIFSPERAEHEFYTLNAKINTLQVGDLVVNELMALNIETAVDQNGEYDDWIELYNNSGNTLSLDNLYISDKTDNLLKWEFPEGTTMSPYSYLIVWADEDNSQEGLHTNFKLSANGENVILSYDNGYILDSVSFGSLAEDIGYARIPNGTGTFISQSPTFSKNNELESDTPILYVSVDTIRIGYQSVIETFKIENNGDGELNWSISNTADWIDISQTEGTNDATINLTIEKNSDDERETVISIEANAAQGSPKDIVVIQEKNSDNPILVLSTRDIEIDHNSGQFKFDISNDGVNDLEWEIVKNVDWLYPSPISGINDTEINVVYDSNHDTTNDREGSLIIVADGAENSPDTIFVSQQNKTSVFEFNKDLSITVFPNPSTGRVNIISNFEVESETSIRIFSPESKVFLSNNNIGYIDNQIDLSGYPSGIYIIEIKNKDWVVSEKLILLK